MSDDMKIDDYKLSVELLGHSLDVRTVAAANNCIVSGSRDKTAKIWERSDDGKTYKEAEVLRDHTNFVSAVCVFNEGKWLATASNDKTICVYLFGSLQPFATLKEHTNTVCALSQGLEPSSLISGSWDMTARVYKDLNIDSTSMELKGHDAAVWSVTTLTSGKYVTGSADKNIFVWSGKGEKLVVLKGHTDCVRGVLGLPDGSLLSCSNDATIRHWSDTYDCLKEFHGHANYIYAMAQVTPGFFVTGSEDSTIRMWSLTKGAVEGVLALPVQSVWSLACNKDGDIIAGSSDGSIRVFTKDPARVAEDQVLAAFDEAVATRIAEQSKELGGVKVNDLPGPESLLQEGTEGQTRLVRQPNGKILCYQWTNGNWECVGDVMGGTGGTQATSGKSLFEGKEYDFVFNVDIEDGAPPLKLPFNKTDDPWLSAQKFIHKHDLPQVYLEQVANFIITNANLTSLPPVATSGEFADPFTGGGRYIPGSGTSATATADVQLNFRERSNGNGGMINMDPFTGGDSYSSGRREYIVPKHIPFTTITTFDVHDSSKILMKLIEFNSQLEDQFKVTDDALASVVSLIDSSTPDTASLQNLEKLLNWPEAKLFPVLDVVRLVVRNPKISSAAFMPAVMKNLNSLAPNQLMSARALSNAVTHDLGKALIEQQVVEICEQIGKVSQGNANLQIAIATFFLNQAIIQRSDEGCTTLAIGLVKFLEWASEPEAVFRAYQALGNLISYNGATVLSIIKTVDQLKEALQRSRTAQLEKLAEISVELSEKLM